MRYFFIWLYASLTLLLIFASNSGVIAGISADPYWSISNIPTPSFTTSSFSREVMLHEKPPMSMWFTSSDGRRDISQALISAPTKIFPFFVSIVGTREILFLYSGGTPLWLMLW